MTYYGVEPGKILSVFGLEVQPGDTLSWQKTQSTVLCTMTDILHGLKLDSRIIDYGDLL